MSDFCRADELYEGKSYPVCQTTPINKGCEALGLGNVREHITLEQLLFNVYVIVMLRPQLNQNQKVSRRF